MEGADVIAGLAQLAARICEARAAGVVPRLGEPRCWTNPPFELAHLPRCLAMAAVLERDEVYIIGDVQADGRLNQELALGPPMVRFFAALPVVGSDGRPSGTLIVADDRPRDVSAEHRLALRLVARIAGELLAGGPGEPGAAVVPPWLFDLADNAPIGLHALDATGAVLWMNQTELRWLGYAREDVVGKKHIGELVPADWRDGMRRALAELATTGRVIVPDAALERRDGRSLPVHIAANDVRGDDGAVVRTRHVAVDRSELRARSADPVFGQSEDARQLSQVRRGLDAGLAAAWHLDLTTGQFRADGALAELLGVTSLSVSSYGRNVIVHPDDVQMMQEAIERARRDRGAYRHVHRLRSPDGAYRWVAVSGAFRYDADDNPVSLSGVMMAIDEPAANARRTGSGQPIVDILEGISDGFVALDRDWRYTYVNRHAGKIFGRSPADLVGRHIWTEFPEGKGQRFHLAYERARREQIAVHMEEYYPPWDRWFENRIYPAPDGGLLIFFTDVTDRHQRDEGQRQTAHRLRQLTERLMAVRDEEAARLSREVHDGLGQLLAALKLDLSWIARQLDGRAEELGDVKQKLGEATRHIDELFAAVRRMSSELRPRMLEDLGLAATIDWYVRGVASRSGLACELALDAGDVAIPRATATALYRVLQECLTNVVRHANARCVDVRLERHGDDIVMTVRDDGGGVTAAQAALAPGLGLLGARERMTLIGGSFDIDVAPHGGTIATARAPIGPSTPE